MTDAEAAAARDRMVEEQLRRRGVVDERVLMAMARVDRRRFVGVAQQARAYDDSPLAIGHGQTISQPYIVARTLELAALRGAERVLEIGAGSGYQTALLAELSASVFAVERLPELARQAEERLASCGYRNIRLIVADGSVGWPDAAPFDAIVVSAGAPETPSPLLQQLTDGGRLVAPIGERGAQRLVRIERRGDAFHTARDIACVFVDLVGRYGWSGDETPSA